MPYYSVIDDSLTVDSNHPLVAFMRKPRGKNPEHAFLMIEELSSLGKVTLTRYDLFMDNTNPELAIIIPKQESFIDQSQVKQLFSQLLQNEEVYARSWNITTAQKKSLEKAILADQQKEGTDKQIRYLVYGDRASSHPFWSREKASLSNEVESCVSWAINKLQGLNDPAIIIKRDLTDFIGTRGTVHIAAPNMSKADGCRLL